MARRRAANSCPECGSPFTIDLRAETDVLIAPAFFVVGRSELQSRRVTVPVAFCSGCEFSYVIQKPSTT